MNIAENKQRVDVRGLHASNRCTLLHRLSIVSLLAMLITASLLIFLYRADQIDEHTRIAAEQNEKSLAYLTHFLDEPVGNFVNNSSVRQSAESIHHLDSLFSYSLAAIHETDTLKLKLYDLSGATIYSSVSSEIGGSSTHPDFLARALRGETVHKVEFRDDFFGVSGEMRSIDIALTYKPLNHAGKRIGVIELYSDVTPVFKHLKSKTIQIALIVMSAFSALYAALFFAVFRTDRAVARWQKKIAESEDALRKSQQIAGLGTYVLDIRSGVWESSEVFDHVFGIDKAYERTVDGWQAVLHPDNRQAVIDYLRNDVIAKRQAFDREFCIVRDNDQLVRWVHGLGQLEFDAQGYPVIMHGTVQDITARKQAEIAFAESRNLLQAIIDTAPMRIFWKDKGLRYLGCNPAFARDAGVASAEEIIGKDDFQFCWKAQAELYRTDDLEVIDLGIAKLSYDEPQTTPDGKIIWLRTSKAPLRNASNEIIGLIGIYKDITEQKQVEMALKESEGLFRQITENIRQVFWVGTSDWNHVMYISPAYQEIWGRTCESLYANPLDWLDAVVDADRKKIIDSITKKSTGDFTDVAFPEYRIRRPDGSERWIYARAFPIHDANGKIYRYAGIAEDITQRKRDEEALRVAAVAFETHEGILITDALSNIVRVNRAFTDITGYSAEEVLGRNPRIMSSGRQDRLFYIEMWQNLLCTGDWAGEIWDRRKNGEIYPKWLTITAVKNDQQETTHYVAIFSDITARKRIEEEIHHLAFYDVLTRLPNRRLFLDRFNAAMIASTRRNDYGAVLFIDMDRFKVLNDTLGHDYGDLLLIEVGVRIKSCVREMDTVARYGGDEFVVLIDGIGLDREDVTRKVALVAEKIREVLALPYVLKEHEHHSSPSIGISLYHGNDESMDSLIEHADMAMYQAKKSGRNAARFFDPVMQQNVATHDALDNDLHHAIALQQLHLHYQIQVDKDNRPLGAEAFLRWIHPEHGMIMPDQFIPLAEESALIIDIDRWVLHTVCRQLALWSQNNKTRDLTLTVNISAKLFAQSDFIDEIAVILNAHLTDPTRLKLELSERLALTDMSCTMVKINALKSMGVRLSMDNFATVYSSLSYLKQLSSDQLKIHQEFVRGIMLEGNDAQLVRTVVDLARSLEMDIFAQGVETQEQRNFLDKCDCNVYQGYLFGKPVTIDEFDAMLEKF
jgi:diguanylate cyclase (GGDEF)-like protein/PAS domain S-box-containing protein